MKTNWWYIFCAIANIASIAGIIIALLSDKNIAIIALISLLSAQCLILIIVIHLIKSYIKKKNPQKYLPIAHFNYYKKISDTHIIYDAYRIIQAKDLIMTKFPWNFKWTGKQPPIITSNLQECDGKIIGPVDDTAVIMVLKKPIYYDDTETLHFHSEMNDIDHSSQPHSDVRVDKYPYQVIYFKVELLYPQINNRTDARIMRAKLDSRVPDEYKTIDTTKFDSNTMSYNYVLYNPEVGYNYRIEWD